LNSRRLSRAADNVFPKSLLFGGYIFGGLAMRFVRSCLLLMGLVLVGGRVGVSSSASTDASLLVGTWRYAGEVDTKLDGSPAPAGVLSDVEGLLFYTPDGFVSVVLMPKGRSWSTGSATLEELRETVGNGTAYAGRYTVDPVAHTVTHVSSVNLEPAYDKRPLVRTYSIAGDTLKLTGTFGSGAETVRFVIAWERVR
jgi:hypothetical protein